jgi:hypothetical protein|tara:strand:+ start:491 stop:820 length:330 start_codon:yes stop_codon:yes gene_type:complete
MPTYDFEDTKTGKVWTDMMSISDKEAYLKKNKHIKQCISKINISSGVMGVGSLKTDGGWKDMLSRIGDAHPGSKVHDIYGNKSIKEIQTRKVVKKHQKRQAAQRKARGK